MINADISKGIRYDGTGLATVFDVPWRVDDAAEIQVVFVDETSGDYVQTTPYTVGPLGEPSSQVTFVDAPPGTVKVWVRPNMPVIQPTNLRSQGRFDPEMIERALDRLTTMIASRPSRDELASDADWTLRELLNDGANPGNGAALVAFAQNGLGAVIRNLLNKARDIVHADDFGLLGNGSDETLKLQRFFNAAQGKLALFGYGKTYGVASATGVSIPDNTTLLANGSKLKRLQAHSGGLADSEYNIVVGSHTNIDRLEVECIGGGGDIGGVLVAGTDVTIGALVITSPSPGSAAAGNLWNAVRIGPNTGTSSRVRIGWLECTNFDRPVAVQNVSEWVIGFVRVANYRRALYLKDCPYGGVLGGHIFSASPNADGSAGDNGVLMESAIAHHTLHDVLLNNLVVEDAAEHGIRGGGAFGMRDVFLVNPKVHNCGSGMGTYPPANNGGCGIKFLGPTSVSGSRHQNIQIVNPIISDINAGGLAAVLARGGKTNFAGIHVGKCFGVSIVNPIIIKRPGSEVSYAEAGNSCFNGIEIVGCQKVTVTNPQVQRPVNSGVYIYDWAGAGEDWGQTDDVVIDGGSVNTPGVAGVEVVAANITMRRINIDGVQVNGGVNSLKIDKSGAGAFVLCTARMTSISASGESFAGLGADWMIDAAGTFVGTNACRDGSFYRDLTSGIHKRREGGVWRYALYGSKTFDVASLVDAAGSTTTVTVTGAALGDFAQASLSVALADVLLTAWVSAADTVSVRFQNESGGTVDLASATLRARVEKAQ